MNHCTLFRVSLCQFSHLVLRPRLSELPAISEYMRQSVAWRSNTHHVAHIDGEFVEVTPPKFPQPRAEYEISGADGTEPVDPNTKIELYRNDNNALVERVIRNGKIISERLARVS